VINTSPGSKTALRGSLPHIVSVLKFSQHTCKHVGATVTATGHIHPASSTEVVGDGRMQEAHFIYPQKRNQVV
jgi:hypothetical protein